MSKSKGFYWTEEALLGILLEAASCKEELPWNASYGNTKAAWEAFYARAIPRMRLQTALPAITTVITKIGRLRKLYKSHVKDRCDFTLDELAVRGNVADLHALSQLILATFDKEDKSLLESPLSTAIAEDIAELPEDILSVLRDLSNQDASVVTPDIEWDAAAEEDIEQDTETLLAAEVEEESRRKFELVKAELLRCLRRDERVDREQADRDHELAKMRLQHELDNT